MARFNIQAHLHRVEKGYLQPVWVRYYARIETAIRRCTEYLIIEGEVGDIIEFVLKLNGYQVGVIKLKATGKIDVVWNDTEAKRERNKRMFENVSSGSNKFDEQLIRRLSETMSHVPSINEVFPLTSAAVH
jgi:hypothetical protein